MPYIEKARREVLDDMLDLPNTTGELNYVITQTILDFMRRKGKSYATMSSIRGVLVDVSTEFYRRVMAPYEDQKKEDNGDVY